MLTTKEVAEFLNVDVKTVHNLISEKRIKAYNIGNGNIRPHYRIKETDLQAFIAESEVKNESNKKM